MSKIVTMQYGKGSDATGGGGSGGVTQIVTELPLDVDITAASTLNRLVRVGNICCLTVDLTLSARPGNTWWYLGTLPEEFRNGSDFYYTAAVGQALTIGSFTPEGRITISTRPGGTGARIAFTVSWCV